MNVAQTTLILGTIEVIGLIAALIGLAVGGWNLFRSIHERWLISRPESKPPAVIISWRPPFFRLSAFLHRWSLHEAGINGSVGTISTARLISDTNRLAHHVLALFAFFSLIFVAAKPDVLTPTGVTVRAALAIGSVIMVNLTLTARIARNKLHHWKWDGKERRRPQVWDGIERRKGNEPPPDGGLHD